MLHWSLEMLVSADPAEETLRATLIDDAVDLALDQLEYLAEKRNLRQLGYSEAANAEIGATVALLLEMVAKYGGAFQVQMPNDPMWPELIRRASKAAVAMKN